MPNLPAHRNVGLRISQQPAVLTRRDRREIQVLESTALVEHIALQLRQSLAQSAMLAETAVTQTAMASVTGTAASAAALRKAVPEVAEALAFLQTKHTMNLGQRIDQFAQGR